eukprot:365338-Chlamydomonas_euryale.AAC.38
MPSSTGPTAGLPCVDECAVRCDLGFHDYASLLSSSCTRSALHTRYTKLPNTSGPLQGKGQPETQHAVATAPKAHTWEGLKASSVRCRATRQRGVRGHTAGGCRATRQAGAGPHGSVRCRATRQRGVPGHTAACGAGPHGSMRCRATRQAGAGPHGSAGCQATRQRGVPGHTAGGCWATRQRGAGAGPHGSAGCRATRQAGAGPHGRRVLGHTAARGAGPHGRRVPGHTAGGCRAIPFDQPPAIPCLAHAPAVAETPGRHMQPLCVASPHAVPHP